MDVAALLVDLYGRIPPLAREAVDGLDLDDLASRPGPDANSISWLVWHVARVQDHQVSDLADHAQLWVEGDWSKSFGLDPDPDDIGYGHTSDQVARVRPARPEALIEYLDAVDARNRTFIARLDQDALDRIIDRSWDPPVTVGVRMISVADDGLQHLGQAAYVRGLLGR